MRFMKLSYFPLHNISFQYLFLWIFICYFQGQYELDLLQHRVLNMHYQRLCHRSTVVINRLVRVQTTLGYYKHKFGFIWVRSRTDLLFVYKVKRLFFLQCSMYQLVKIILLLIAELYLKSERMDEALACVTEAGSIFPISYMVSHMVSSVDMCYTHTHTVAFMYVADWLIVAAFAPLIIQRGRLHEKKEELHEAKMCYENAVSINPTHVRSLQHLVRKFKLYKEKMCCLV